MDFSELFEDTHDEERRGGEEEPTDMKDDDEDDDDEPTIVQKQQRPSRYEKRTDLSTKNDLEQTMTILKHKRDIMTQKHPASIFLTCLCGHLKISNVNHLMDYKRFDEEYNRITEVVKLNQQKDRKKENTISLKKMGKELIKRDKECKVIKETITDNIGPIFSILQLMIDTLNNSIEIYNSIHNMKNEMTRKKYKKTYSDIKFPKKIEQKTTGDNNDNGNESNSDIEDQPNSDSRFYNQTRSKSRFNILKLPKTETQDSYYIHHLLYLYPFIFQNSITTFSSSIRFGNKSYGKAIQSTENYAADIIVIELLLNFSLSNLEIFQPFFYRSRLLTKILNLIPSEEPLFLFYISTDYLIHYKQMMSRNVGINVESDDDDDTTTTTNSYTNSILVTCLKFTSLYYFSQIVKEKNYDDSLNDSLKNRLIECGIAYDENNPLEMDTMIKSTSKGYINLIKKTMKRLNINVSQTIHPKKEEVFQQLLSNHIMGILLSSSSPSYIYYMSRKVLSDVNRTINSQVESNIPACMSSIYKKYSGMSGETDNDIMRDFVMDDEDIYKGWQGIFNYNIPVAEYDIIKNKDNMNTLQLPFMDNDTDNNDNVNVEIDDIGFIWRSYCKRLYINYIPYLITQLTHALEKCNLLSCISLSTKKGTKSKKWKTLRGNNDINNITERMHPKRDDNNIEMRSVCESNFMSSLYLVGINNLNQPKNKPLVSSSSSSSSSSSVTNTQSQQGQYSNFKTQQDTIRIMHQLNELDESHMIYENWYYILQKANEYSKVYSKYNLEYNLNDADYYFRNVNSNVNMLPISSIVNTKNKEKGGFVVYPSPEFIKMIGCNKKEMDVAYRKRKKNNDADDDEQSFHNEKIVDLLSDRIALGNTSSSSKKGELKSLSFPEIQSIKKIKAFSAILQVLIHMPDILGIYLSRFQKEIVKELRYIKNQILKEEEEEKSEAAYDRKRRYNSNGYEENDSRRNKNKNEDADPNQSVDWDLTDRSSNNIDKMMMAIAYSINETNNFLFDFESKLLVSIKADIIMCCYEVYQNIIELFLFAKGNDSFTSLPTNTIPGPNGGSYYISNPKNNIIQNGFTQEEKTRLSTLFNEIYDFYNQRGVHGFVYSSDTQVVQIFSSLVASKYTQKDRIRPLGGVYVQRAVMGWTKIDEGDKWKQIMMYHPYDPSRPNTYVHLNRTNLISIMNTQSSNTHRNSLETMLHAFSFTKAML